MTGCTIKAGVIFRLLFVWMVSLGCALGGFDEFYTSASEDQGTPPKVRFNYKLSPYEDVSSVAVMADGVKLVAELASYTDDSTAKTAVLFLIDTSNPRRKKEVAQAKKLVMKVLSQADEKRHNIGIYPFHGQLDEDFAPMGTPLKDLKKQAESIKANGLNTILYGSVLKAIDLLAKTEAERKAIVVISDWKSEDNVMDAKEFVAAAVKGLKAGKIVCHSLVLVEEDQSELDTAERLCQVSGGQLVKITKSDIAIPASFSDQFLAHLESGGSAVVDMGGREKAAKVVLEVETQSGKKYSFEYDRVTKRNKKVTPAGQQSDPNTHPNADPQQDPQAGDPNADPDKAVAGDPTKSGDDEKTDDEEGLESATGADAESSASDEKGSVFFGLPVWAIIAAVVLVVVVFGGIAILLMRNKDDEFVEDDDTQMMGQMMGQDEGGAFPPLTDESVEPSAEPPALPSSPYPREFELGNGTATCQTLPTADEEVLANLQFGAGGSRGTYPISKTAVRIGRGSDNDLTLKNDSVSRHHAEILCKRDGSFVITDLDSGNGVFVNDEEVTQKEIQSGDKIEIGEVTFTFTVST